MAQKVVETLKDVTVIFAGDSGDGMQLVGNELANTSAIVGNDIGTLPDFPAEIRAPQGTLAGVSGYQLKFGNYDLRTPGDIGDTLIAMNPAALKVNLPKLKPNGVLIVDTANFEKKNLALAKYESNPLEDYTLDKYQVFPVNITNLTREALKETGLDTRGIDRCKNFFALGMVFWLYNRPLDFTINIIKKKFAKKEKVAEANILALRGGYAYCEATEAFAISYEVKPAKLAPGKYRSIMGNTALALGLVAATSKAKKQMFYGGYPITPASDILHELAKHKNFGIKTFQAEDEIAGVCSAIGASYAGAIGVTATSGPGLALKTEAIGLAIATELPLVIIDVQRAGPSTGMPTKTEQSDLFQAVYGRNGDAPIPVMAAATPSDCFEMAYEATRIAIKYMTPVILLTDNYVANGAEPWKIPNIDTLKPIEYDHTADPDNFHPYTRNPETLARKWIIPGTKGLQYRIGGIERQNVTGNISYDPDNHQTMNDLRFEKVDRIANEYPATKVVGDEKGDLLVISWGGTYGATATAVERAREEGYSVSHAHLRYVYPLPNDLGGIIKNFKKVLIPELNNGQLVHLIRDKYVVDAICYSKVKGQPFVVGEIQAKIAEVIGK
ncbi:MAG: 2-oxoacid:acceptor oxidoreductase subunit alpha [Calditrichaeota bacterium]|nr:MAG: 2-oxoacid:acceptor oxidoreductase subunit alpha [Calditrichota bacterium]